MDNIEYSADNIINDNIESVETILEYTSSESKSNDSINDVNYISISNNLNYEIKAIKHLCTILSRTNILSVRDIEILISYKKDIKQLLLLLMDYNDTLNSLEQYNKQFDISEINGTTKFCVKIFNSHRKRNKRLNRKTRKRHNR